MESTISPREFFVVQYPGIVKNDERAIETLGGLQSLNKSFNSLTRRLRLSFRPEMLFSKPVYGDPHSKTALIICAKQLRNRRTGEVKASDIPLFLPPLLFTRLDQPTMYCFSSRFRINEYVELENNSQQHPYHRKERKSYAMFVNFGDPIPSAAHPGALQAITSLGPHTRKLANDVEKLFRRRPIWGKASLVHSLNWKRVRECAIKTILPAYAYYMPNGPWGRVWVRFGYDPCKDPSSRMYQTVDYRVRSPRLQAKLCISGRRPRADDREDTDPSGSDVDEARDTSIIDATLAAMRSGESPSPVHASSKSTSAFRFSKTSWPDARQILYQLVDIDVPEVVEMLAAPMCRTVCDPNYGWMPADYQKTIREIMTRYLETWVLGNATFSKTT
ncbi:General transcription factor 3C polypeptide 5 [Echinococcus granulosus]|uniref:General transcription factor 3C polypeptide 5 n=1 Tax=Echinococcus granulosus TaxID=6210 RepID=W6UTG1_ECHGR|nr:General transcription factor 3C polypeptide 5 [Echinococcus granulosus]EUB56699.1 General transcription factor 3C polypeptide 5 [Echinococcus granulosus]